MTAGRRYDLLAPIAEGGMGQIFLAELSGEAGFRKRVALKRIKPELSNDPQFVEKFVSEAKLAVSLSHANIVQTLDLGRLGETLYIALEYVEGIDLSRLMARCRETQTSVPLAVFFHVAVEALKALAYAHQHVLHNDISPANLLISFSGEVKLTDFGVAMWLSLAKQPRATVAGKLRYLAPEALRGEPLDGRADLYALTIVLRELLTLQPAFDAPSDALPRAVLAGERRPLERADLPGALTQLLDRASAADAALRPASATKMLAELMQLGPSLGQPLTPPEIGEWVAQLSPRPKAVAAPGQALVLGAVAGGTSSQERQVPTSSFIVGAASSDGLSVLEPVWPADEPPKRRWPVLVGLAVVLAVALGVAWWPTSPPPPVPTTLAPPPPEPTVPAPTPTVRPPEPQPTPTPVPARQEPVRRPPKASPKPVAARGVGFLNVASEPWANVRVDGVRRGTTPLYQLELPAGLHTVILEREGVVPVKRDVRVEAGETALLDVDLR